MRHYPFSSLCKSVKSVDLSSISSWALLASLAVPFTDQRLGQHLRRVQRVSARRVVDLVSTGGAGGDDQRIGRRGADGREEGELADLERQRIAVGGEAERAGHAAAAGGQDVEAVAGEASQARGARLDAPECLLVAVAVKHDRTGCGFGSLVHRRLGGVAVPAALDKLFQKHRLRGQAYA